MTGTFVDSPKLPPVPCEPWCVYQDDRADQMHREDQYCHSEQYRIDMTLEPGIEESRYSSEVDHWVAGPDYFEFWAHQIPGEPIEVRFSRAGGPELRLTRAEAYKLMMNLFLLMTMPRQSK